VAVRFFLPQLHLFHLQTFTRTPSKLALKTTTIGAYGCTSLHLLCHERPNSAEKLEI
jgi:hypothetical protein